MCSWLCQTGALVWWSSCGLWWYRSFCPLLGQLSLHSSTTPPDRQWKDNRKVFMCQTSPLRDNDNIELQVLFDLTIVTFAVLMMPKTIQYSSSFLLYHVTFCQLQDTRKSCYNLVVLTEPYCKLDEITECKKIILKKYFWKGCFSKQSICKSKRKKQENQV